MHNKQEPNETGKEGTPGEKKNAPRLLPRDRFPLAAVMGENGSKQKNEAAVADASDNEEESADEAESVIQNDDKTTICTQAPNDSKCPFIPDAIDSDLEWNPNDHYTLTPRTTFISNQPNGDGATGMRSLCGMM